jgi:DNA-binding response OmpR family regulator
MVAADTILVVEPLPSLREAICSFLRVEGYETLSASTGKEGVSYAIESRPDVIVFSLTLPDMHAREFIKTLQSNPDAAGIITVMLYSKGKLSRENHDVWLSAYDALSKPFAADELICTISALLNRRS